MSNEINPLIDLQGLPRKLRNKIDMYPIKMRDSFEFKECVQVLNIDKNSTNDANVLQMSYLKFLLIISHSDKGKHFRDKLLKLLQLIFRTEDVDFTVKLDGMHTSLKKYPDYIFIENVKCFVLVNGDIELSEFDFSKIKNIVGEQNMIEMSDDKYQSKEYKEAMARARKLASKRNGKPASIDQLILSYKYEMKIRDINEILDMTLYQFNKELETIAHIKNSDTLLSAVYSGMVKPKDNKTPYWLNAIEKPEDDPLKVDAEEFANNMSNTLSI